MPDDFWWIVLAVALGGAVVFSLRPLLSFVAAVLLLMVAAVLWFVMIVGGVSYGVVRLLIAPFRWGVAHLRGGGDERA